VRSGRLTADELTKLRTDARAQLFRKSDEKTRSDELKARYPEVEFDQQIIEPTWIRALFFDGWVAPEATRRMLDASPYYSSPTLGPAWRVAWMGWQLSDDQYEEVVARIEKQFKDREVTVLGELLHVFGLMLGFSDVGVIKKSRAKVTAECKSYIDDLKKTGRSPGVYATTL